jgi:peptide/nickel transport system substrate-binding protein
MSRQISRREFLRTGALTAAGLAAAACAPKTVIVEKTVKETVEVEKVVKETVVVEKEVEKVVKETVMVEKEVPVEKEVIVTATPSAFASSPMYNVAVSQGKLPPLDERLPQNPLILDVVEEIGEYGGTWRRAYKGVSDRWGPNKVNAEFLLEWRMPEGGSISIVPHMAESFEQNEDASAYTFYMRKGIKWSDGTPWSSEDARFWYEDLYANETVAPAVGGNSTRLMVEGEKMQLEVNDDFSFTCKFAGPNPLFPLFVCVGNGWHATRSGNFFTPSHYMKQFHADYGDPAEIEQALEDFEEPSWDQLLRNESRAVFWFLNENVPAMHAWETKVPPPSDQIMMERNPYYHSVDPAGNQLPYIDRVTHRFFDNNEVFALWLINGEIDCQNRHVNPANFTLFRENEEKGDYRLVLWRDAQTYSYHPNLAYDKDPVLREILNDVRFRNALSVALDRTEINELAFDGVLEPRQACPVTGSPNFDAEWETYLTEYDPDQANAWLDEMGLDQRGSDGFRLRSDGETLTILLEYATASFGGPEDMHDLAKEYWEAVGIKVLLRPEERSLYEERSDANEVQLGSWVKDRSAVVMADPGWYDGASPGGLDTEWWTSGGTEGVEPLPGSPLFEIWDLWEQVSVEPDQETRDALFKRMMDINKEQTLSIGVVGEAPAIFLTKNNMRNVPAGLVQDDPLRAIGLGQPPQFFFRT